MAASSGDFLRTAAGIRGGIVDWRSLLGVPAHGKVPAHGFSGFSCRLEDLRSGALYFAFPEFLAYNRWMDGRELVGKAVERGAAGIVSDRASGRAVAAGWVVPDPRVLFAKVAWQVFGCIVRPECVGVTGTNGKTTTVRLIAHLANATGTPAGSMGTLGCCLGESCVEEMNYTTDLAHETARRLARLREAGARLVAMEVSSHGLALDRVAGLPFRVGVFTNLTQDHLDFHGDAQSYLGAKRRLFESLAPDAFAVLNAADAHAHAMAAATAAQVVTFSARANVAADLVAEDVQLEPAALSLRIRWQNRVYSLRAPLAGGFQAENILAALGALLSLGYSPEALCTAAASFRPVPGRMETIVLPSGAVAVIDYAHNPGGLENLLRACRRVAPRRLLLVFGCGGDRDRTKRPIMGRLAEAGADRLFVTSDNPRTEDPPAIIADILRGLNDPGTAVVEPDRARAIRAACEGAVEGDVVVVAGKGHEDYQIIGLEKCSFSDRGVIEAWTRDAGESERASSDPV